MQKRAAYSKGTIIVATLVILMLVLAIFLSGIPSWVNKTLFEKETYTSPQTSVNIEINTDGSASVTEQRTFSCTNTVNCIKWPLITTSEDSCVDIRDVWVTYLDNQDNEVETVQFSSTWFDESWKDLWKNHGDQGTNGPGSGVYALDRTNNSLYTFISTQNQKAIISINYVVSYGVVPWRDVAEIDWSVISGDWNIDSNKVTINVVLPVAAGNDVISGENVCAWSHGPQGGGVLIDKSGIINYTAEHVVSGQYVHAHILFPVSWLSNLPKTKKATQHANEMRSNYVQQAEQKWSDSYSARKIRGEVVDLVCFALCAVLLILVLIIYFCCGKDYKPTYTKAQCNKVPNNNLHPAIIGRLWRWNREATNELIASIMNLVYIGAAHIVESNGNYRIQQSKNKKDWDSCDKATLCLLFDRFSKSIKDALIDNGIDGTCEVEIRHIQRFAEEKPEEYKQIVDEWQRKISSEVKEHCFFEKRGTKWQVCFLIGAFLLIVLGVGLKFIAGSNTLLLLSIPTAVLMSLVSNYMPRRTQAGQNLVAEYKALAAWMEDLPQSKELLAHNQEDCDKLMICAELFDLVPQVAMAMANEETENSVETKAEVEMGAETETGKKAKTKAKTGTEAEKAAETKAEVEMGAETETKSENSEEVTLKCSCMGWYQQLKKAFPE